MTPEEEAYRKGVQDAVDMLMSAHPMWAKFIFRVLIKDRDAAKKPEGD